MRRTRRLLIDTTPSVRFVADAVRDFLRRYYADDENYALDQDVYNTVMYLVLFAAGRSSAALINTMSVGIYRNLKNRNVRLCDIYDMLSDVIYDKRFEVIQKSVAPDIQDTLGESFITKCSFRSGFRTLKLELSDGKIDF